MKATASILILSLFLSGCVARKIVTIPVSTAIKTTVKAGGKVAIGTTQAVVPGGGERSH
jgi:hypothetical protein